MNDHRARRQLIFRLSVVAALTVTMTVVSLSASRAATETSQTRSVAGFERVRVQGSFKTEIRAGESRTHVVVTANSDVIDRVTAEVVDDTLVIGMKPGTNDFKSTPRITIALPILRAFSNEGAGSATIAGLGGGDFAINNSGAASITASGRVESETIALSGVGKIDASAVEARDATVDNNGVGSIHVRASGLLAMSLNGVGEIRYAGNPTKVTSHVNGIGRISPL